MLQMNLLDVSDIVDKSVKKYEGYRCYVATGDLIKNNIINSTDVTFTEKPSRANREVEPGDIIFAKMKSTVKVLKIDNNNTSYIFSTGFSTIRAKEKLLNKDYLYYVIISKLFQRQKDKLSKGATQKAINNAGLSKIKIPVPDLEIQYRIVKVLKKLDVIIKIRKHQINFLSLLKKSLFKDILVNKEIKKTTEKLKELILTSRNGMARRGNNMEGNIVLKIPNIKHNFIDYKVVNRIALNDKEMNSYNLEYDDLLLVRVNGNPNYVGRSAVYLGHEHEGNVFFNDHIIRLKTKNIINNQYLAYYLNSSYGLSEISKNIKTSAGQYTISRKGLDAIDISFPDIEKQNNLIDKFNKIDEKLDLLNKSLVLLDNLYESIMQKAYKGELFVD